MKRGAFGLNYTTHSEMETERIATALAAQLRPGDVLLLRGELGAGKTVFARGIARGLGITGPISSPTFTLLNCHEAAVPLHHFDLYRLEDADEFYAAGLQDAIGAPAVAIIEWPERAEEAMPVAHLEIQITYGPQDGERIIDILPVGGFREVAL